MTALGQTGQQKLGGLITWRRPAAAVSGDECCRGAVKGPLSSPERPAQPGNCVLNPRDCVCSAAQDQQQKQQKAGQI